MQGQQPQLKIFVIPEAICIPLHDLDFIVDALYHGI